MAIYVQLSEEQLRYLADVFELGEIAEATGIPQGSINSNFRLATTKGRYFLRHTTVRSPDDLEFEASLVEHLLQGAFPAPVLVRTKGHAAFVEIAGGRATLFKYLPGDELTRAQLSPEHLERLGREVGKLHRVGQAFRGRRENPYGPPVVRGWLEGLSATQDPEVQRALPVLQEALGRAETWLSTRMLPRGPIHADIFLDNVKWLGDQVCALFDFEMACVDAYVLDFAITLNAWCFDGTYQEPLCRAFTRGYELERTLSEEERQAVFSEALFGAVRYTASRIRDFHLSPLPPDRLFKKDFRTYLARVHALQALGVEGFRRLLGL